jgi:ribose transport system ATP-binding protein
LTKDRVLQVSGISKRFPGVIALDRVTLEVAAGEAVALVGENGAGKSTLMKILAGVYRPDDGEIRVGGRPVVLHSPSDATRLGIAVIHQELEVVDTLDVAANICLGREPLWGGPLRLLDRQRMEATATAALARLQGKGGEARHSGLRPRRLVRELSTAERQLLMIARALTMETRILILDEPTSSLTLDDTNRLLQVLQDLRTQGVAIIYISHRLAEVESLADRVVVLRDGRNAGTLEREAIDRDTVVRMMVDRDLRRQPGLNAPGRVGVSVGDAGPDQARSTGATCLTIEGLRTRRYPNAPVSLTLRRGEVVGLAGLIGSGRTELAEAISGVSRPVAGHFVLDGERLEIESPRDAMRKGIFLVPEDRRRCGLMDTATVRDNITLPALWRQARTGLIRRRLEVEWAVRAVTSFGVKTPSIEVPVSTLSGGNQQKVVLARWLSLSPRVMVFDEPTRGIDVGARADIYEEIRALASAGAAILMVSSDIEEILDVSDRVAVMHDGRVTGVLEREACTPERVMQLAVA